MNQVQILDEVVNILFCAENLRKGMKMSFPSAALIVRKAEISSLGIATGLDDNSEFRLVVFCLKLTVSHSVYGGGVK